MSATRDKSQKVTFVYSNLYQIYKKGQEAASKHVLKSQDLNEAAKNLVAETAPQAVIRPYTPAELIGKRIQKPAVISSQANAAHSIGQKSALDGLKNNLKTLNQLHSRLRFMLQELEDLVKE